MGDTQLSTSAVPTKARPLLVPRPGGLPTHHDLSHQVPQVVPGHLAAAALKIVAHQLAAAQQVAGVEGAVQQAAGRLRP